MPCYIYHINVCILNYLLHLVVDSLCHLPYTHVLLPVSIPVQKYIKGDNSREMSICAGWGYPLCFDTQFQLFA